MKKRRFTCLSATCDEDTGSAAKPLCPKCAPQEPKLLPIEKRWANNEVKKQRKVDEQGGPYDAGAFWNEVKARRADTGERERSDS